MTLNLDNLLRKPFGPFLDTVILADSFPPRSVIPPLEGLRMECAGTPIGLDESEYIITPPPKSRIIQNEVTFYGILTIQSLDWLSPRGHSILEEEFRERDQEQNLTDDEPSRLTLERLYGSRPGEGSKISVYLLCIKQLQVNFLTSKTHPDKFIIYSQRGVDTRSYEVRSLNTNIVRTSQAFLARFRLWALINHIIETDPERTPLESRTIDYLVAQYLHNLPDRFKRAIPLSRREESLNARNLRHIPEAELKGIFAEHAEWLLAYQLAPQGTRLWRVNMREWIRFCLMAKRARLESHTANVQWGGNFDVDEQQLEDNLRRIDLSRFGGYTKLKWSKKLEVAIKTSAKAPKAKLGKQVLMGPAYPAASSEPPDHKYDYDFSEPSTPPDSDSEPPSSGEDSDLQSRVPAYMWETPVLPLGCFVWRCPGCSYQLDLLNLRAEDTACLPTKAAESFRAKRWPSLENANVHRSFHTIVSAHFESHLRTNKVRLLEDFDKRGKPFAYLAPLDEREGEHKRPLVKSKAKEKERVAPKVKRENYD